MDTKWNNTTEAVEIEPVMPQRKGTGLRAVAAFLTFFMGVSLTLGSLCGAVGRRAIGSDYAEWWQNDWQETPVFRNRISNDLESFLAIGVGRTVDWYHPDYSVEDTVSGTGTIWFFADTPTASCETSFAEAQDTSPDSAYKHDLNTIYAIRAADGKKYSNLEEVTGYRMALDEYSKLPKGYNFLLSVVNGAAGGLGFTVAIVLFASVRERVNRADCPACFKGFPIALISAGLLALAFMGFSGLKVF